MALSARIGSNGPILMLLAAVFFSFMDLFVKALSNIPASQLVFMRFLIYVLLLFAIIKVFHLDIGFSNPKLLFTRGFLGFLSVLFFFQAIASIKVSDAVVLFYTFPVFSIIFSHFFLGERIERASYIISPLVILGVILILKPSFDSAGLGHMLAIASGIFAAAAFTALKKLEGSTSVWSILVFQSAVAACFSAPFLLMSFNIPSIVELSMILIMALLGLIGLLLMTLAFRYCTESEGSELLTMEALLVAVLGFFIFGEQHDLLSLLGFGLIISGAFYLVFAHEHIQIRHHHS